MFDAQFRPQTFITCLHIRRQGIFKKVQFLGILHIHLVSLQNTSRLGGRFVRLDSTMFDAQFTPKLLLPGLHIGGREFLKKYNFFECLHIQSG